MFLELKNINKWYGDHHVLKDINLSVEKGERVIICGPSGSGKSTTIRCINGLEEIDEGVIEYEGVAINNNNKQSLLIKQEIGMVFQAFHLFPHLTVLDNCTLAPQVVKNIDKKVAEETALEYLRRVNIVEHKDKYPKQLSGGQQQRAAIARSLCMQPELLLFDEPTSALDPEMVAEVLDVILDLTKTNITLICVTHEMGFARKAANRIIFMDDGKIVVDETPDKFFTNKDSGRLNDFLSKIL